jgi:hypothetical protein
VTKFMKLLHPFCFRKPPTVERRLHNRVMLHWQALKRDSEFVLLKDFDPMVLEDHSTHGFLLDLTNAVQPVLRFIGPVLRDEASIEGQDIPLADVANDTLLRRFADRYPEVSARRTAIPAEYDFITSAGYHVLCRGVLLPLSSDGVLLDHVYGVISWKSEKVGR